MKKQKRIKAVKKQNVLEKNLQMLVFSIELVLLAGILFVICKDIYKKSFPQPVVETAKSEVRKLPPEVKKTLDASIDTTSYRVPILMYHYVEYVKDRKDTLRERLNIEPDIFEQQIKTLKDAGFTFMTASELGDVLEGKTNLPKDPILITIDDGHWDLYTDILPILEKYHVKATAYIITGFLGGSDFLSDQQLHAVIDSGLVDIGAHTVHHYSLPELSPGAVQYEVSESKAVLEKTYKIKVSSFAYPNGAFNLQTAEIVKDNKFTLALSTVPGIQQSLANRYFLYRLRPGQRTGEEMLSWLRQESFSTYASAVTSKSK